MEEETKLPTLEELQQLVAQQKDDYEKKLTEKDGVISGLSTRVEKLEKESIVKILGINLNKGSNDEDTSDDGVDFHFEY